MSVEVDEFKIDDLVTYLDTLTEVGKNARDQHAVRARQQYQTYTENQRWKLSWLTGSHDEAIAAVPWMQGHRDRHSASGGTRQTGKQTGRKRRRIFASDDGMFTSLQTLFARSVGMMSKSAFGATTNTDVGQTIADCLNGLIEEDYETLRYDYLTAMGLMGGRIYGHMMAEFNLDPTRSMYGIIEDAGLLYNFRDPLGHLWSHDACSLGTAKWMILKDIMPVARAKRLYQLTGPEVETCAKSGAVSNSDYEDYTIVGDDGRIDDQIPRVLVTRCFYRAEDDVVHEWATIGTMLVRRKENPLGFGMFPLLKLSPHKIPSWRFPDPGDVETKAELQAQNDLIQTSLLWHQLILSAAVLLVRAGALDEARMKNVDLSDIMSIIGSTVFVEGAEKLSDAIGWLTSPNIPSATVYGGGFLQNKLQNAWATHDVAWGRSRADDSGRKVLALSAEMDKMIEGSMYGLGEFNRGFADKWLHLQMSFADPDIIRAPLTGILGAEQLPGSALSQRIMAALRKAAGMGEPPKGTWGEVLEIIGVEPFTKEAHEWARRVPIEIRQVPMTESRRSRELNEFISYLAAGGANFSIPGMEWINDTIIEKMNDPVARRNWELQKRKNDVVRQLAELVQATATGQVPPEVALQQVQGMITGQPLPQGQVAPGPEAVGGPNI